ncbi:hypothetical protein [Anaeromicropila populeti]|uniref:DUF4352 domain-containing protein n=1 Tax=Anaeromicropila populeti TaxID=37658 RepID=A0A1I6IB40_9FIRM|nr:hypothetical protein [Anaeromicropila populeti]SFR63859.1 hypothetical protein SAMN05661086_00636 [Anaeromicropila populeti]
MKKQHYILLILLCFSLAACSSKDSSVSTGTEDFEKQIKELKQQITDLESENEELKEQLDTFSLDDFDGFDGFDLAEEESTEESTDVDESTMEVVEEGDTIVTERMEIKLNKVEFSHDVLPDNVDGMYTHYEADADHVYIHIDTDIKNILKQKIGCDELLSVEADYNDGFNYSGFTVPENGDTDFTYDNITSIDPLETKGIRFLIDCPQEVEDTDNSLFVIFEIDQKKYKYIIR